jgi:hypothetical protein
MMIFWKNKCFCGLMWAPACGSQMTILPWFSTADRHFGRKLHLKLKKQFYTSFWHSPLVSCVRHAPSPQRVAPETENSHFTTQSRVGTISAEGWSGTNNVERPEKLSTQKLFQHTEAFTERSFYTRTLLHRSVKVQYIVCPLFVAIWYALSWSEARLQAGMMWTYSQLDLDGFKFQASTVSVWWTMCERGASTIELACGVKTWVLSHHQPLLANDCSKIE